MVRRITASFLIDFGLAKRLDQDMQVFSNIDFEGTLAFTARSILEQLIRRQYLMWTPSTHRIALVITALYLSNINFRDNVKLKYSTGHGSVDEILTRRTLAQQILETRDHFRNILKEDETSLDHVFFG